MTADKRLEDYTDRQIRNARRLIDILMGVSEQRRPIITAIATAYIDGVEAGTRIAEDTAQGNQMI